MNVVHIAEYENKRIVKKADKIAHNNELSYLEIYDIANEIRNSLMKCKDIEPTPIVRVAEKFGIKCNKTKKFTNGMLGNIVIKDGKKIIFVDESDTLYNQRFIIAYELGYYLFYYPKIKHQIKYFTNQYYPNDEYSNMLEKKRAYLFALELLIPTKILFKEYNDAWNYDKNEYFIIKYLSKFFQIGEIYIRRKIEEKNYAYDSMNY